MFLFFYVTPEFPPVLHDFGFEKGVGNSGVLQFTSLVNNIYTVPLFFIFFSQTFLLIKCIGFLIGGNSFMRGKGIQSFNFPSCLMV